MMPANPTNVAIDDDARPRVCYQTHPSRYAHWKLSVKGEVATFALDVNEDVTIQPGYKLKLNSYDLGVDIELADALDRIRFEHPEVRCVVLTSAKERVFCSGANIYMLAASSHAWKVNFCKFTNETRNGMEDSSRHEGIKFLAACNGNTAGGGYELALACDEIILVDDRSSAVSVPEVPLLGVLPGTGGLTRLTDKRRVRRDQADLFCTLPEGVRAPRALDWKLVDHAEKPAQFEATVQRRVDALRALSDRGSSNGATPRGITLTPLQVVERDDGYQYQYVRVDLNRSARVATFLVQSPATSPACEIEDILQQGASWYPLQLVRELDDAILRLRSNEPDTGLWLFRTEGDAEQVLTADRALLAHREHWLVRATIGYWRRTLNRLEISSRSLFALIESNSCFVGTLFELALAADRSYMCSSTNEATSRIVLSKANFGLYATLSAESRLAARFYQHTETLRQLQQLIGQPLNPQRAIELGLVTAAPDDIDWEDEIRLAIEERASLSPDALTGLEQNLRFGAETMETRIFGRLSAWQNWIFNRPNAVGLHGTLKTYGSGAKVKFDWERV